MKDGGISWISDARGIAGRGTRPARGSGASRGNPRTRSPGPRCGRRACGVRGMAPSRGSGRPGCALMVDHSDRSGIFPAESRPACRARSVSFPAAALARGAPTQPLFAPASIVDAWRRSRRRQGTLEARCSSRPLGSRSPGAIASSVSPHRSAPVRRVSPRRASRCRRARPCSGAEAHGAGHAGRGLRGSRAVDRSRRRAPRRRRRPARPQLRRARRTRPR